MEASKYLAFPELRDLKSQLICYGRESSGGDRYYTEGSDLPLQTWLTHHRGEINLTPTPTVAGWNLAGELQPFRLHDTYCADLTLFPEDANFEIRLNDLPMFALGKLLDRVRANLGKVLVLYGEQAYLGKAARAQEWANALCAEATGIDRDPEYIGKIQLFDCSAFLFAAGDLTIAISLSKLNQLNAEQARKSYGILRDLFWSQKKIEWGYARVRQYYSQGCLASDRLKKRVDLLSQGLNRRTNITMAQLEYWVRIVPQELLAYEEYLHGLREHRITLERDMVRFDLCLSELIATGNQLPVCLDWSRDIYPYYLSQTKIYIENMISAMDRLSNFAIATASTIEIMQGKMVAEGQKSMGIGIAVGIIVAICCTMTIAPAQDDGLFLLVIVAIAILFSITAALVSWKVAKTYFSRTRQAKPKRSHSNPF